MRDSYLDDYYSFLRFASVSTDDQYKDKVNACADWLVKKLQTIGLETKLVPTAGHPVVWAHNKQQPGRRTVMIYGAPSGLLFVMRPHHRMPGRRHELCLEAAR